MSWSERIKDTSAFGGIPIGIFIALFSLAVGNLTLFYQLGGALALNYGIAAIIRTVKFEKRPDNTPAGKSWLSKIDASSFPSLHAARIFSFVIILGIYFSSTYLYALLIPTAVLVCYLRICLKRHYLQDIIAGATLGILVGIFATKYAVLIAQFLGLPV
ncbi:MAG TPA: phosphatase PAP2 family protein [Nanoarchaeota archaeon]|nr:phosphatase PAP2 family protein [Nanoarchaeota archaeon]